MRMLRASLLATFLTALIAVPVAVAAQGNGPGGGTGGMPAMPGMQMESPAALGLGGRQGQGQGLAQGQGRFRGQAQRETAPGRPGPGAGAAGTDGAPFGGGLGQVGGRPTFRVVCGSSHLALDDPIVYPGQPGKSHLHSFVGNVSTGASSTAATLLAAGTTCDSRADLSAYWLPALIVGGEPVTPTGAHVYYRRVTAAPVKAFPAGFRLIAGDDRAMTAQPLRVAAWSCGQASGIAPSAAPVVCPDATENRLRLRVTFPSCWDGTSLDSADHRSHVAYAMAGVCPATHPVPVPELSIVYAYPTRGDATTVLASGGVLSAHADFMNAWRPGTLERIVDRWLNRVGQGGQGGQCGQPGQGGPVGQGGPGGQPGSGRQGPPPAPGGQGGPPARPASAPAV